MKDSICFKEVLVLLWCAACAIALHPNVTICAINGNERDPECPNHPIFSRLSNLTVNETAVHIYLTGGTHILNVSLTFTDLVEETEILGASHGQPSRIECKNNAGIRFSENRNANRVSLSNITLLHCHRTINIHTDSIIKAALYFKNAVYTLSSVTVRNTAGWGLYAYQCNEHTIFNCTFTSNEGNIQIVLRKFPRTFATAVLVKINETKIHGGKCIGKLCSCGINVSISAVSCTFSIVSSEFLGNKGGHLLLTSDGDFLTSIERSSFTISNDFGIRMQSRGIDSNSVVIVQNSTFSNSEKSGLYIMNVTQTEITGCVFANSESGVWIERKPFFYFTSTQYYYDYKNLIRDCLFQNNAGTGIILDYYVREDVSVMWTEISRITYFNNSHALDIYLGKQTWTTINISECNFTNNRVPPVMHVRGGEDTSTEKVFLEKSSFNENRGYRFSGGCSVLRINNVHSFVLNDVNISDNNCTGISFLDSEVRLENSVTIARNFGQQGGGLWLRWSVLIFTPLSKLNIINNTAYTYGGGIYSDETCENGDIRCFFQSYASIDLKVFVFSGNLAKLGGDVVFGGCLSNCFVEILDTTIDKCDPNNTFWDLVSSKDTVSQSTFVDNPYRVEFCTNTSSSRGTYAHGSICTNFHSINAYRGEVFNVSLMVADDCCFPSVDIISAKIDPDSESKPLLQLENDICQKARKSCHNFSYAITGGLELKIATITYGIQKQYFSKTPPSVLKVHLNDCPTGYVISSESGKCKCHGTLIYNGIECNPSSFSLLIPAQTWVGELENVSGHIAVQKDCQHCYNEGTQTITNITRDSHKLCISSRTGIMCGACVSNYSLQLGGYECADCSNSTYKGVLLLIAFTFIGIALVLLLLGLNLTVSTGMINELIFYSNIVYLNSDALLPITREGSNKHLQNTIRIMSTFQAWVNLDFGINTCFFDGYDTYISTWMQFVFPLYIWLLILTIVLASRYSNKISKITTSNTVSVLATLLLLSYAKLLKTSIEAFSSVQLQLLDGSMTHRFWKPDANIFYLSHVHTPLFLMSLVMVAVYVIPFTLLILLGPLLQAKSHHRLLNWINKLKPFLDAFYGPYTRRYRYWPGILLLARLVILGTFAFYSPNNIPFKLLTVSVMTTVLLVLWMLIGKVNAISLNQKKISNYLELFLMLNLTVFTALSVYATQFSNSRIKNQQGLAVAMVGSVLAVFCGILGYQVFRTVFKYKAMHKLTGFIPVNIFKGKEVAGEPQNPMQMPENIISTKTTHSLVEMTECVTPMDELREPLLTVKDDQQ